MYENIFLHVSSDFNFLKKKEVLSNFKIFKFKEFEILGKNFEFNIIGHSHCVVCESLNYIDVFSSSFLDFLPLLKSYDFSLNIFEEFDLDFAKVKVVFDDLSLDENLVEDLDNIFDLFYVFDNNSYTGIKILKNGYETVHTYPEFGIKIVTFVTLN